MTESIVSPDQGGRCAERHSAQALTYRIQKPNSHPRSYAFVVHDECRGLFESLLPASSDIGSSKDLVYVSGLGFAGIDELFAHDSPDFLTLLCPASPVDAESFSLVIRRLSSWMSERFVTTVLWTQGSDPSSSASSAPKLIEDLRAISSQVVWVDGPSDLQEILKALRIPVW